MSRNNASRAFVALNTGKHVTKEQECHWFKMPYNYVRQGGGSGSNNDPVTLHAPSGIIETNGVLDSETIYTFVFNNDYVKSTSRVFLQAESEVNTASGGTLSVQAHVNLVQDGALQIKVHNPDTQVTLDPTKIHFFIINDVGDLSAVIPS